jgi:hypothetical protein
MRAKVRGLFFILLLVGLYTNITFYFVLLILGFYLYLSFDFALSNISYYMIECLFQTYYALEMW